MFRVPYLIFCSYAQKCTQGVLKDTKRYAGHSKWANIKHQKGATDAERMRLFARLSRMLKVAVIEGKSSNPELNSKLESVIGQCKRANMPASTIANSIKSATSTKGANETSSNLYIRGPGRCSLMVEIITNNVSQVKNSVSSIMKKHGCKYDNTVVYDYLEKGIITTSPLKDSTTPLDDATEHAILSGLEEVTFDDENKKLKFECSPEITLKSKKALEGLGYNVDSAIVEYHPVVAAKLDDEQLDHIQKFMAKVEAIPEVVKITDNIE